MKREYLDIDQITKEMDGHMLFAVKSKGGRGDQTQEKIATNAPINKYAVKDNQRNCRKKLPGGECR
jgi:hypothetical protein